MELTPETIQERLTEARLNCQSNLNVVCNELYRVSRLDDQVGELDRLRAASDASRDEPLGRHIGLAISSLRAETIMTHFEEDVLPWAYITSTFKQQQQELEPGLEQYRPDIDPQLLESARLFQWQHRYGAFNGRNVLDQYQAIALPHGEALQQVDLPQILAGSTKKDREIKDGNISRYGLHPLQLNKDHVFSYGWEQTWGDTVDRTDYALYLDAPSGFALTYDGAPQAVVALSRSHADIDGVRVHQLQGVTGKILDDETSRRVVGKANPWGLEPLDWQKCMIGVTEELAEIGGYSTVEITPGRKNRYIKPIPGDNKPHLTIEQAERAYDQQAKRLGYTQVDDGNWTKVIA